MLRRQQNIPVSTSAMIILMEKLLSLAVVLLLLGTIVFWLDTPKQFKRIILYAYIGCFVLAMASGLIALKKNKIQLLLDRLVSVLPVSPVNKNRMDVSKSIDICKQLFQKNIIGPYVLFTVAKYIFDGFRLYFVLKTIGFDLAYMKCLAGSNIIYFVIAIPILPGAIGSFEFISISVLHYVFSVPLEVNLLEIFLERILSLSLLFGMGMISLHYVMMWMPAPQRSPKRRRSLQAFIPNVSNAVDAIDKEDVFEALSPSSIDLPKSSGTE
jgi:uncharacterized protein (TIRG00374 family)